MNHTRNFADLSSNNGADAFDAVQYAASGHVLLANKATDGRGYVNPFWATQTHAAHEHHISVLNYHYAEPGDPRAQADHMLDTLRDSRVFHEYDAIALDIERGQGISNPRAFVEGFDKRCVERGHKTLIVYTELSYHEEHGLAPRNGRMWIADYDAGFLGGYWADQYSDRAIVHGINGRCDVSRLSVPAYVYRITHRP